MRTLAFAAPLTVLASVAMPLAASTAHASTCAATAVSAKSEPSRFEWTARAKARANWRAKVRAMPSLGAAYANWNEAAETLERCLTGPAGSVCILSGIPCTK